jgi:hypothetical protein
MNQHILRKYPYLRVRLQPLPFRFDFQTGQQLPFLDERWVTEPNTNSVSIFNPRTYFKFHLPFDWIYGFQSDPAAPLDGLKYGFLRLLGIFSLQGSDLVQWTSLSLPVADNLTLQQRGYSLG